jgi:hypothetical protein
MRERISLAIEQIGLRSEMVELAENSGFTANVNVFSANFLGTRIASLSALDQHFLALPRL